MSLAEAIPSLDTRVLIYCNNNFDGNPVDFTPKVVTPASLLSNDGMRPEMEIVEEKRPSHDGFERTNVYPSVWVWVSECV